MPTTSPNSPTSSRRRRRFGAPGVGVAFVTGRRYSVDQAVQNPERFRNDVTDVMCSGTRSGTIGGSRMTTEFIVSGDAHIIEPVDLFKTRLPKNLRDRALWEEEFVLDEPLVPGGHTVFRTWHSP